MSEQPASQAFSVPGSTVNCVLVQILPLLRVYRLKVVQLLVRKITEFVKNLHVSGYRVGTRTMMNSVTSSTMTKQHFVFML